MESVMGFDWAAVPSLLDALTEERTKMLALSILQKYQGASTGTPNMDDIKIGLEHPDATVRLWAEKLKSAAQGDVN